MPRKSAFEMLKGVKETYLTREQLNARKFAPVFTTTNIPKI